ncbi:dihydrofolate reductase family protein [Candidatus Frankia nodulisporulans]|uniref:dihydrofolate reductase family protein n=1 Tax=Candidatus Frankia nodulisporulans TaxID=2060052 RepID=UPI0013D4EAEC|nr:dihydrofolate reductase family protein [Candidatus Frankia nodulisporulans]
MRLALHAFLTLDGVMQAPGGPREDTSGGFTHGGWLPDHADEESGAAVVNWFSNADAFLLGRTTYEIFSGHWPRITDESDPIASALNSLPKYVASTTLTSLGWDGAQLLEGDVAAAVTELKKQPGRELQVHGSAGLARTLIEHDLVDEYRLVLFPLHLGTGKKLFADGAPPARLRLLSSRTTARGLIITTYEPAGPVTYGSFALDDEPTP